MSRRHQVPRRGLVAGGEANHAVELRAFDLHLNVIHDQVAARQDVVATVAGAVDEIARRGVRISNGSPPALRIASFTPPTRHRDG